MLRPYPHGIDVNARKVLRSGAADEGSRKERQTQGQNKNPLHGSVTSRGAWWVPGLSTPGYQDAKITKATRIEKSLGLHST